MHRRLNITSKNSNEIYSFSYPQNLLKFIKYDFTAFTERCIDLCRISIKKGDFNRDEVSALRGSISPCHMYYEKNMFGVFEKIVIDCWIEYICRQNEINPPTLWNSFTSCKNDFEKAVFSRLCEYRYNNAINQWVNMLKIQEYAIKKTDFVFGKRLEKPSMASARAGYFDLLFNVAANEMGYGFVGSATSSKVYSAMRTPNSPFVMSGTSREIMRNVLKDIRFLDTEELTAHQRDNPVLSDKNAMDAFSVIKTYIPDEPDSIINTIIKSFSVSPQKVYIPESFKAVIDLEIDALIESGAVIQRCARCREYFVRDENYDFDCCSRVENGRTCLDIMSESGEAVKRPLLTDPTVLYARCDQLYKEMAERVNVDITQRDFSDWYRYMILIRDNIVAGMASMDDFENFAEYSRTISFPSNARALLFKEKEEPIITQSESKADNKDAKPFVFEKIERKENQRADKKETLGDLLGFSSNAVNSGFTPYIMPPMPAYVPQQPTTPPITSRVIRGVIPSGVSVIGNSTGFEQAQAQTPPVPPIPPPPTEPIEEPDDVKIYNKPKESSDRIEDFVKVYQSASPERKPKKQPEEVRETRAAKYEKGGLLKNPYIREIIKADDVKKYDALPDIEPVQEPEPVETPKLSLPPVNEPAPAIDFSSILSGMDRKDGFGKTEEEAPASHKTKRVMDAIFGKSKSSNPFVSTKETDEDYD
ncbi:MAG: hypothetical protein FWD34_09685 [Oscillospiraceae bacterium]|nr:hypothetical protein [Oscillospiraceae bacterium]